MAQNHNMEEIEKEIRELILHSKCKRTTVFEPCNENNLSEYLTHVQEEMILCGVKYRFDPFNDLNGSENTIQAMVRLVNAIWNLLMLHKEMCGNGDKLKERNYALQQNNFFLNKMVGKLNEELVVAKNKSKQIEEIRRQFTFKFEISQKDLSKATDEIKKIKKQAKSKENQLETQIKRLQRDYLLLQDKARGQCGTFVSKTDVENLSIEAYKSKEKKYKETITKLQESNKQLLLEVIGLKDDLINSDKDESD